MSCIASRIVRGSQKYLLTIPLDILHCKTRIPLYAYCKIFLSVRSRQCVPVLLLNVSNHSTCIVNHKILKTYSQWRSRWLELRGRDEFFLLYLWHLIWIFNQSIGINFCFLFLIFGFTLWMYLLNVLFFLLFSF